VRRGAWEDWGRDLGTVDGRQKMFRVEKQMRRDKSDVEGTSYIKDENGVIEVDSVAVAERWRRYFERLLNEENEHNIEDQNVVEGPIECVSLEKVEDALRKMKNSKAPGLSGLSSDLIKYARGAMVNSLLEIFRNIEQSEEVLVEWSESLTIPIYKCKGDAFECGNYRGLRLLKHAMKIWEKVLNERLKNIVRIGQHQFGFMAGRSTVSAVFILRQLKERYVEKNKILYHIFVDLEKAYDKVPRCAIEWALRRQMVPERLIRMVMALYSNTRSRVRVAGETSEYFNIEVGVHQGSILSPLLFILVMEATKN
jgi:hypothetical protein